MKLHELNKTPGKSGKRVGRGPGSGSGKTSGRGEKGQKARSGATIPATFEGGQLPLYRKLPRRGFKNPNTKNYAIINVGDLNVLDDGTKVTPALLIEMGIINKELDGVKILGDGELTKKLSIEAHAASRSALEKISASGSTYKEI